MLGNELGDVAIREQGYYAMSALGIAVALLLGAGLMWLVYFSHRTATTTRRDTNRPRR